MGVTFYHSMMNKKHKISVSVSGKTLERIREALRSGRFRNRSHLFEHSVNRVLEGEND